MPSRTTALPRRAAALALLATLAACTDAAPTAAPRLAPGRPSLDVAATRSQAFNFRGTVGYVADAAGETYANVSADPYPTSRDGRTFGWVARPGANVHGINAFDGAASRRRRAIECTAGASRLGADRHDPPARQATRMLPVIRSLVV